jgi:hypothetical protein
MATTNYRIDSTRTLPYHWNMQVAEKEELKGLLTELHATAVNWWINRGSYTYAFFGANKISRAARLISLLRERDYRYQILRYPSETDNIAVTFIL